MYELCGLVEQDLLLALHEVMVNVLTVWAAKIVAAAYGLFALGLAVLYSLSRSDTWRRSTDQERQELQKGTTHQSLEGVLILTDLIFIACKKLWSLSTDDDELSHNFLTLENGLQIHYLANEKTTEDIDTLVIYLHGFPDTCWLWEQQLRSSLSSKAHLVALDLPGCGGSDSHSFYGPDEILNAVAEAIVQLKGRYLEESSGSGSPQRSVLVSHDW